VFLLVVSILLTVFIGCKTTEEITVKAEIPSQSERIISEEKAEKEKKTEEKEPFHLKRKKTTQPSKVILSRMSLSQKIGQRFIGWLPKNIGTEGIDEKTIQLIEQGYVSGFILYPWNYESAEDVRRLTSTLQELAARNNPATSLFISVDQEGGRVAAFRYSNMVRFPAPFFWAGYRDERFAKAVGYITGVEIKYLGCNMNLAPVLDLYGIPDSTIIGDRSMGDDPEIVSRLGTAYIKGMHEAGVIAVAKHFPGHGVTQINSHAELPVSDKTEEELFEREILPFKAAIENGLDAVMTAHILYPKIDGRYPATLSEIFVKNYLRRKLGFRGVVISDGFSMGALSKEYTVEESLLQCFKSGIDLILVHSRYDVMELKEIVFKMVEEGILTEEEIDQGARRIIRLKEKYNLLPEKDLSY